MYAMLLADDADDAAIFGLILQRAGLAVTTVRSLDAALENWSERPADLVLSAVVKPLPDEQVRRIRAITLVPLALAVRTIDPYYHYELLKMGADLVIEPTFQARPLIAQLGVLMRRAGSVPAFALPTLDAPGLTLDPTKRSVHVEGKEDSRLTHLEFRLLYTLMMNRNQPVPTDTIVEAVWGFTGQGDRDLVRGLINRLRAKIEQDRRKPRYIVTVSGIGYQFNEEIE